MATASEQPTADPNIIPDVICVQVGEARGHKFVVDDAFVESTILLGNQATAVKCRINHPGDKGNVLSIVGEISDFYRSTCLDRDGVERNCAKAKLKVYDLPDKVGEQLIALAAQASKFFGLSLDAGIELTKRKVNGLAVAALKTLNAIDVVDTPAATPSLFAADLGDGRVTLSSYTGSRVDLNGLSTSPVTKTVTSNLEIKTMAAEDIKKDEVKPVDKTEERFAALEAFCKKMEAYMAEDKPEEKKDEKPKDEKADMSAITKGIVAQLEATIKENTAREFTALLAKTGAKLSVEDKAPLVAPIEVEAGTKLSAEAEAAMKSIKMATGIDIDRKQLVANIDHTRKFLSL